MIENSDIETDRLKQQLERGDYAELRQYLARTHREEDWQDRCYLLNFLSSSLQYDAVAAACASEPEAADLLLLLGVCCFHKIGESRGAKTADLTSQEQFEEASVQIHTMMDCLMRVYSLEPNDPTPRIFAMRGMVVFTDYANDVRQEYTEAVRLAPDLMPAHYAMVNARSKKWGGSYEEALGIARAAMKMGRIGSDLPGCLFFAHFLVWQYEWQFDKNKDEANRYVKDPRVNQELNQALDRWIGIGYQMRRSSLPYLHQAALWYYLSGDYGRLKQIFALTGKMPCDQVWRQIGDPTKAHSRALQRTAPAIPQMALPPAKKAGLFGWFKK